MKIATAKQTDLKGPGTHSHSQTGALTCTFPPSFEEIQRWSPALAEMRQLAGEEVLGPEGSWVSSLPSAT